MRWSSGAKDRDADAAAQRHLAKSGLHGSGEQLEDALRRVGGRLALVDVLEQDRELVAAEARRDVGAADAVVEPPCELDEHLVARRMAQ